MASKTYGVGVIGLGYWGKNYLRLVSQLSASEGYNVRLIAMADVFQESLDFQKKIYPGVKAYSSADELLADQDVDLVVIVTQATTHFQVASKALQAGKHVLVEKPLTTNSREAATLVELANSRGLVLFTGHTFLHNTGIQNMKKFMKDEKFGDLYSLNFTRTNLGPFRTDVDCLWDLAPHDVAILLYLMDGSLPVRTYARSSCLYSNLFPA